MKAFVERMGLLYPAYVLAVASIGYVLAELGHFLIGSTSKHIAADLHYGDVACQLRAAAADGPTPCGAANTSADCLALTVNGTSYCEWTYNGLGLDYQILAGPSFIAVYTVVGIFLGYAADKCNRVRLLAACTLVVAIAIALSGGVGRYWEFVVLRMLLAAGEAGCNPLSTGILSDLFAEDKRALVMAIFNWGIYGGYGISFPIGRYVTKLNLWDLGWRACFYGTGAAGLLVAAVMAATLREPERKAIAEAGGAGGPATKKKKKQTIWSVMLDPRVVMLALAASIRHTGGLCFAYNCDLYYLTYFPTYDLGWWLFAVTIVIGGIGIVVGGVVSDKFVAKMGIRSRILCLAVSQIIATPFAFGSVYFNPVGAMISLGISYFFAEMWFGILFAVLVEIVPLHLRSFTVGVFLFVMNNIGGNIPILVEPVSKAIGYRESLYIFYAGFYGISSFLFLLTLFLMDGPPAPAAPVLQPPLKDAGHDNSMFTPDENGMPTITSIVENSKNRHQIHETSRL